MIIFIHCFLFSILLLFILKLQHEEKNYSLFYMLLSYSKTFTTFHIIVGKVSEESKNCKKKYRKNQPCLKCSEQNVQECPWKSILGPQNLGSVQTHIILPRYSSQAKTVLRKYSNFKTPLVPWCDNNTRLLKLRYLFLTKPTTFIYFLRKKLFVWGRNDNEQLLWVPSGLWRQAECYTSNDVILVLC